MEGFDEFWQVYPRKIAKKAAERMYKRALKNSTAEAILAGAERYARERRGEDVTYTKHPATWLNGGCWEDCWAQQKSAAANGSPIPGVRLQMDTPAWRAWQAHLKATTGKGTPHDRNFGWYFPSKWPPGQHP